jgi:5-methylthioadenosine/S-adenosylhomocysteine deaminase
LENILISRGTILTIDENDTILEDGAIAISDGRIISVGATQELIQRYPDYRQMDATGMVVMPGLVNAHTHLGSTILRGISDDVD